MVVQRASQLEENSFLRGARSGRFASPTVAFCFACPPPIRLFCLLKVSALKADLEAKSRAATAGWDAAAGAESEAAAAEARGLEAGIKRGHLDTEKKARGDSRSCAAATVSLRNLVLLR